MISTFHHFIISSFNHHFTLSFFHHFIIHPFISKFLSFSPGHGHHVRKLKMNGRLFKKKTNKSKSPRANPHAGAQVARRTSAYQNKKRKQTNQNPQEQIPTLLPKLPAACRLTKTKKRSTKKNGRFFQKLPCAKIKYKRSI